jgi:putative hemolysin
VNWLPLAVVAVLIVLEGAFVAAEIALVSLRESQVTAMAEVDRRGRAVRRLTTDPNRWLSAVQIGVTLCALFATAYGAESYVDPLSTTLRDSGLGETAARVLAFAGVTLTLTYFTLVIAELVPKRLALQRTESTARVFAPTLDRIATTTRPVIWLLSKSTDAIVRLLGGDPSIQREQISDDELRGLVAAHEGLSSEERTLVDDIFEAAARTVIEVMVPRTEVTFLEAGSPVSAAIRVASALPHSRYPVTGDSSDDVVGFVHLRDLLVSATKGQKVGEVAREVKRLPGSKPMLKALSEMRREGAHLAVVVDEYGGTAGIVTLEDLIEELIGDIRDEYDAAERDSDARRLRGGDLEVDGLLHLDDFCEETGVELPEGPYETAAGFVLHRLGRMPRAGDAVELAAASTLVRLAVTRLDGRRISRIRVTLVDPEGLPEPADD